MDWFGTVRLRAGYIPWDPLLIYLTGGLAVGHVKDTATITFPAAPTIFSGDGSATKLGWTLGAGVEWAIYSRWTAKLEYLYYNLGNNSVNLASATSPGTASSDFPAKGSIVRVGINYRF